MSNDQKAYAIRMARATEQDIEAVNTFWETICGWAESEDRIDADSVQRVIDAIEGSFNRVFWGYQVLHDNACDKSLSYLDYKPEIKGLEQQRDQLLAACERGQDILAELMNSIIELGKGEPSERDVIEIYEDAVVINDEMLAAIAAATNEASQ